MLLFLTLFLTLIKYSKYGDFMKSLITIFLGVVTSVMIGVLFIDETSSKTVKPVSGSYGALVAFQLGAYSTLEQANKEAEEKNGIVVKDDIHYLVYSSLLSNTSNIERMMKYLDDKNIYYYVKTIDANDEFTSELYKYEEMMKSSTSDIAFLKLNSKILELYGEYYEN